MKELPLRISSFLYVEARNWGQTSALALPWPPTFSKTKGSSFHIGLIELVVGDSLVR